MIDSGSRAEAVDFDGDGDHGSFRWWPCSPWQISLIHAEVIFWNLTNSNIKMLQLRLHLN